MKPNRNHLKEQMKDPKAAKAYYKKKDILDELAAMLPKERVERAVKEAKKEIARIRRAKK